MDTIAIIMPARDAEETIVESMASVLEDPLVSQLIVVDDGSEDRTDSLVQSIDDQRVTLISTNGEGIAAAYNHGLKAANSSFIARCDADDLYPRGRVRWQYEWLKSHEEFVAISGGYQTIGINNEPIAQFAVDGAAREITQQLVRGEGVVNHFCAWMIRAQALIDIGGARPWFETSEDADLVYRLAGYGRIWHEPKVAYLYRLHESSITHNQSNGRRSFYNTMAMQFAKQRFSEGTDALEALCPPDPPSIDHEIPLSAQQQIADQLVGEAWKLYEQSRYLAALRKMLDSIVAQPKRYKLWKGMLALMLKSLVSITRK